MPTEFANAPALLAGADTLTTLAEEARDKVRVQGSMEETVLDLETLKSKLGELKETLKSLSEGEPDADKLATALQRLTAVEEAQKSIASKPAALKLPEVEKAVTDANGFVAAGRALLEKMRAALPAK